MILDVIFSAIIDYCILVMGTTVTCYEFAKIVAECLK